MKRYIAFLGAFVVMFACPVLAQTDTSSDKTPSAENVPEANYHLFVFLPSYRFVSTTGFAGRVGEYDSLNQSVGGDLALTFTDFDRHLTLKSRMNLISRDDYDITSQLRWGKNFTLSYESRSFIRHLDNAPYRGDLSADDIIRTEPTPEALLFGIKRTKNEVKARYKVPNSPITVYVKGGWQARRGEVLSQYYDMGAQTFPAAASCDGSCHSNAQLRAANYTTRNIAAGIELKASHVTVSYEHEFRSFNNRLQPWYDYYGSAIGSVEEALGAPNVPTTLEGYYLHNLMAAHQTQVDTVRTRVAILRSLTFNSQVSYARTENQFTGNPQNSFNADLSLNWNPHRRVRTMVDYHQQNLLNDFIPFERFYPLDPAQLVWPGSAPPGGGYPSLFGNPSYHRSWVGLRVNYNLTSHFDLETYFKRTNITRSSADLWPQVYSSHAALPSDFAAAGLSELWVPHLVPTTFSNTAGMAVRFHKGEWSARTGYEWIGTHTPGYLTDPETSHRFFTGASFSPVKYLTLSNDFSVLLQSQFPTIQRTNHLWANSAYVLIKPIPEYTLSVSYSYLQNNLRSDVVYLSDPTMTPTMFSESLAPFKAISRSVSIASSYRLKKSLSFNVEVGHINTRSDFRPSVLNGAAYVAAGGDPAAFDKVALASAVSMVDVPQLLASSGFDYRWKNGFNGGFRFQYGRYEDLIHPEQTGLLRGYSVFAGRTW